jgi:hypothetical protein
MYQITHYITQSNREAAMRERERSLHLLDQMHLAREVRCAERGCHPVWERGSRLLLRMVLRLHCWATPATRQKLALPCGC